MTQQETYIEVWGDTVSPRHLLYSIIMGVSFASAVFLGGRWLLGQLGTDPQMIGSYSLLIGIGACIVVAVVAARLFKPKRVVVESELGAGSRESAMDAIEAEVGPIGDPDQFPPAVLKEVQMLGLYDDFKQRYEQNRAVGRDGDL